MKHHSQEEIWAKLSEAQQLLARGQTQAEACKELGVSVVTYHRWRKLYIGEPAPRHVGNGGDALVEALLRQARTVSERPIDEVRAENELLRRIATDLLLKLKLKSDPRTPPANTSSR